MSQIIEAVRSRYAETAKSGLSSEHAGVRAVAEAFGYTAEELQSIPAGANMGLSCGNPTATANLREGETVVDLGSGGGLDVFLAAAKVGPTGRAIGIDMTPEMIELARRNAERREGGAPANVEFHLATIDNLPLPDASADCVISNCVINLAPDKRAVFREIARVLKPGGRLAVSDIALKQPLPAEIASDVAAYVGCIAGAITIEDYRRWLAEAGFSEVAVVDSGADLNAYSQVEGQSGCCSPVAADETAKAGAKSLPVADSAGCCAPAATSETKGGASVERISSGSYSCCGPAADQAVHGGLSELLARHSVNDYAASVKVFAVKPA
ncbi:MAG TPA: arsenite methyltransferase [Pyrinomonadaceae bacterium]|nr:arsenite methyltransferase [Pyrinomonadaceae bacterium]